VSLITQGVYAPIGELPLGCDQQRELTPSGYGIAAKSVDEDDRSTFAIG
jgi:hypothetical protein